ncbi:MAG TPA: hypothetical protein VFE05_19910 [Longimicrobiaceae bacterium]|jgi:hypothetical protein|nr:hypothetical protein [Longimicrobiaceae bacterium]
MAMMDELVSQISARANIPPEQARHAAHAAVEFLDGRLPGPLKGHLGSMLGDSATHAAPRAGAPAGGQPGAAQPGAPQHHDGPDLGGLAGKLGGLLGG